MIIMNLAKQFHVILHGDVLLKKLGMAIQALEKQIPMKPTEINDECGYFECPACGDLIYAEGARFEEHKYCLSCGQKLDWR